MKKVVLLQIPSKFICQYDIFNIFYNESKKLSVFDKYYVITDHKEQMKEYDDCKIIRIEKDLQFSSNILRLVTHVDEEIFFLFCEDNIVDICLKDDLDEAFSFVINNKDVGFLRLNYGNQIQFLNPIIDFDHLSFNEFSHTYRYYVSLQPAIWRKEYLLKALVHNEDAWELEINASDRLRRNLNHFSFRSFGCNKNVICHSNFYKSGRYARSCMIDYLLKNNMAIPPKIDQVYYKDKVKREKKVVGVDFYIKNIKDQNNDNKAK